MNTKKMIDFGGEGWEKHIDGLIKDKATLQSHIAEEVREAGSDALRGVLRHIRRYTFPPVGGISNIEYIAACDIEDYLERNFRSPLIQVNPCGCTYVDGELKKACKQMREGGHG